MARNVEQRIVEKLTSNFAPEYIEVIDESYKHVGHVGSSAKGETHFKITIKSQQLTRFPRITAHRKIYEILDEEFKGTVHALAINII